MVFLEGPDIGNSIHNYSKGKRQTKEDIKERKKSPAGIEPTTS